MFSIIFYGFGRDSARVFPGLAGARAPAPPRAFSPRRREGAVRNCTGRPAYDPPQGGTGPRRGVGFGVLLLLTIDGKEEECQKLIAFNKTVGLPAKLSEVGVTVEEVAKCASFMVKDEDLEHYPYVVTEEMIIEAAKKLDY